ncbi:hypothetical protein [Alkaliphilus sp. B6464]|uniref:hypothetical protein n=1 Tax=Alkaliphilus sp. B6464 TaxID=2731219 RepID=UPI001BA9A30E|nr:hypothetical protein [Alkaliphilus sp. B6464]QUH21981.1 hypothetical protein HYG84_18930 [Alkaliphilus sp. B6464]
MKPFNMFNKKGNVLTLEFVIIIIILTFFIFYPFALYSAYQTKDIIADVKDRSLQLVATTGEVTPIIVDSLEKELEFYNLKPNSNQRIIMAFYNMTQDNGEFNDSTLSAGKKTVVEFTTDSNGRLKGRIVHDNMSKAYRKDYDIIRMTLEYPSDNFLNSTLRMIGKKLTNTNNTGAELAFKTSGFIMSEYKD